MSEPIRHPSGNPHNASADPYRLRRFLDAQRPVRDAVHGELRDGQKRSHWMWFFFPQIRGLGHSAIAREFALESLDEARAYVAHPVLGAELREATRLVNAVEGRSIHQIFGSPDDMKFRSSMTLFALATADNHLFLDALSKYFQGESDKATLDLLT
ncbi:DUF1810 domain-containing protein [Robbsia sp. Bb-Pol-6]|uniref:DUF1810 domain-containing protein n=1 Tax=Robbsia betulipollinis TaxID=2981849 RepID=A0ABT3ZKQ5_9BURK|nr:DUF1810 domain-containing protein [Robbsia betulipollinis]MCY0387116.1 DUF1810 domain-containing protein [Robbsia betulipollinis]